MGNKIRVKVFADGDAVGSKEFDQEVVKIGKLQSSNLHLDGDGVGRMHAVLERIGGVYRIIDLGSHSGSVLDGIKVNKNAVLPKAGTLKIGSFKIEYELDEAPEAQPRDADESDFASFSSDPHHTKLFDSLLEELTKISPNEGESAAKYQAQDRALWRLMGDDRKRRLLRTMVEAIRTGRKDNDQFVRHQIASMLNLGAEGLEAVYDLSPDDALDKAHETLAAIESAKSSLEVLHKLDLAGTVERGATQANASIEDARKTAEHFRKGHSALEERLQITIAGGSTLLVAYLSRAGGEELTDEDRRKWRVQFTQIEAAAKKIAQEDQRAQLTVIS
jgi:pSer/pThr/pTyr-binding forkhead associated (FHA) protein